MINIIVLRQLYKEKKIVKMREIYCDDNSADNMIKALPNLILERIITTNKAIIRLKG